MFCLGYGMPLRDFGLDPKYFIREPHNSFLSILSRGGLVALSMWLWMHYLLFRVWFRLYSVYKIFDNEQGIKILILLMTYFILVLVGAVGQDNLEKPFFVVPYYFFWGVVLRLYYVEKFNRNIIKGEKL